MENMWISVFVVISFLQSSVEACIETSTAPSGSLQSPGYPGNYTNNLNCVYVITRPQGKRITLTFERLDLQGTCTQDFLELRDGDSSTSPLIVTVCGTELETPKRSFQNNMYIRFQTDGLGTGTGFRVSYTSAVLPDSFLLIPATDLGILRKDVETTSNITIPGLNLPNPIAVDFDPVERRVYYTDVQLKTISSVYLDGTGQTELKADTVSDGLAVDPLTRLVFYTDSVKKNIAMMTTSGSSHRTIISTDIETPRAIVLDTMNGVMFWTDFGIPPKIERANYDGTDRRLIAVGSITVPNALALDLPNQRIYWADGVTGLVEFSDLNGNHRTVLQNTNGIRYFFGLAYYADYLYVTDWTTEGALTNVSYILKLGTKDSTMETIGSGPFRMNDVHVYVGNVWGKGPNGCGNNNGGCSYFCIPLPGNASKCLYPDELTNSELTTTTISPKTTTTTSTTAATTTHPTIVTPTTTSKPTTTTLPPTKVSIASPDLFDTDGSKNMTLTCDPDNQKPVSNVIWSVTCVGQQDRKCVWKPKPPDDDGKVVTCSIMYSDGQSGVGSFTVLLNYPPTAPPTIQGYKTGDLLQAGDSLTMTCLVRGGKPLVTSVIFSCPGHPDSVSDVRGDTELQSVLAINSLQPKDDGMRCVCTAEWKRSEWYALSATRILSVTAVNATADKETGVPVAAIGGAVAGGGVLLIIIIVVVAVILRKRDVRYEHPKRPKQTQEPRSEENPYDTLGQPSNQGNAFRNESLFGDATRFSSLYDEVDNLEGTVEAPAAGYMHPVAPSSNYIQPTGFVPPICGRTHPVDPSSNYLHPKGTVPANYDPTHAEYSRRIQSDT